MILTCLHANEIKVGKTENKLSRSNLSTYDFPLKSQAKRKKRWQVRVGYWLFLEVKTSPVNANVSLWRIFAVYLNSTNQATLSQQNLNHISPLGPSLSQPAIALLCLKALLGLAWSCLDILSKGNVNVCVDNGDQCCSILRSKTSNLHLFYNFQ